MKPCQLLTCDGAAEGLIAFASTNGAEVTHREDTPCIADCDWDARHLVLYKDPDHPGWYIAFNTRLGISFQLIFL